MNQIRKIIEYSDEEDQKPQHQLEIISLNTDLEERFSPEKKVKNPWIIEPWQNEKQNPSQSPQRRPYEPRHPPSVPKKLLKIKPISQTTSMRPSPKALESTNNCNFSIRVRAQNRPSMKIMNKIQPQNYPATPKIKGLTLRLSTPQYQLSQQKQYQESASNYKTPVRMIAYPLLTDSRKKRKFRKIEKFQSYVSSSLRK